jgi:hypothetical protein
MRIGGRRFVLARLRVTRNASGRITLRHGRLAVASARFQAPLGTTTIRLAVSAKVVAGHYRVELLVGPGAERRLYARTIVISR